MKKKILLFISLLFLFCNVVYAEDEIVVGDKTLNETNNVITDGDDGSITWNDEDKTLVFENFDYEGEGIEIDNDYIDADVDKINVFIASPIEDEIKIILKGENNINFVSDNKSILFLSLFTFNGDLTIEGEGSLNLFVDAPSNLGMFLFIYVYGNLNIKDTTINMEGLNSPDVYSMFACSDDDKGNVNILNSDVNINLKGLGMLEGIVSNRKINIENSIVDIKTDEKSIDSVGFDTNSTYINNSIVNLDIKAIVDERTNAIDSDNLVDIKNSKLDIYSSDFAIKSDEINAEGSIMDINSDKLTLSGELTFGFNTYNKNGYVLTIDGEVLETYPKSLIGHKVLKATIPDIDYKTNYQLEDGNIKVLSKDLINYINNSNNEDIFLKLGNELLLNVILSDNYNKNDLDLINKNLNGYTLGKVFDISILKNINHRISYVTDLNDKVKLSYKLDDDLIKDGRSFAILRVHNGKVELLSTEYNKDTKELLFESDVFSTYAVIYNDKEEKNPNTFDSLINYISILFISIIGIVSVSLLVRKKNS